MRLYWWDTAHNLGDELTAMLLSHYGYEVEWAPVKYAEWVGIGSVLCRFDGFTGTVWGTGRSANHRAPIDLTRADVRALRGVLTRRLVKGGEAAVLGDPGLLASDLVTPDPQGYTAIVPHWDDQDRMRAAHPDDVFVDVTSDDALEVIARAGRVISSSLHGLVLADSFEIPRMWERFDGVQGGGFKFADYATVVGRCEPDEWFRPNPALINTLKTEVRGCLAA